MPSTFNASSLNSSDIINDNITDAMNITDFDIQYSQPVETAPVYLFCCALSLAAISAFLRAGFVLKFFCMMCCIAVQGCVLSLSKLYAFYDHEADRMRFVTFIFICSVLMMFTQTTKRMIINIELLSYISSQQSLWIDNDWCILSHVDRHCVTYFGSSR